MFQRDPSEAMPALMLRVTCCERTGFATANKQVAPPFPDCHVSSGCFAIQSGGKKGKKRKKRAFLGDSWGLSGKIRWAMRSLATTNRYYFLFGKSLRMFNQIEETSAAACGMKSYIALMNFPWDFFFWGGEAQRTFLNALNCYCLS